MEQEIEGVDVIENIVEIVEPPIQNKSTNSGMAEKSRRNMKNKTGGKESKTMITEPRKLKAGSEPRKTLKRKAEHPPTSEMVMDSIKALKKYRGATFDDIKKHMEEKYAINMNALKSHVSKFLQRSVDNGELERIDGAKAEGKYRIKNPENIKKSSQNSSRKEKEGKPAKKMVELKMKVKK